MREFLGISTPAEAIEAMIAGLREHRKWEQFRVDMDTFGEVENGVCFGCAATCTLQQLAGRQFDHDDLWSREYRAQRLHESLEAVRVFELAIDRFRNGVVDLLFDFFHVTEYPQPAEGENWELTTETWEAELPLVEAYLQKVRALDKPSTDTSIPT